MSIISIADLSSSAANMGKDVMKAIIHAMQDKVVEDTCGKPYPRNSMHERKGCKPRTLRTMGNHSSNKRGNKA